MRKVTEQVVQAWMKGKSKKVGNTSTDGVNIYLHGNHIARRMANGTVQVRNAGHGTSTTRERLNGIARAVDSIYYFGQHKWNQTLSHAGQRNEWDGEWTQL